DASRGLRPRRRPALPALRGQRPRALAPDVGSAHAVAPVSPATEHKPRLLVEHGLAWSTAANVAMNQLASLEPLPENGPALVEIINGRDTIPREALLAAFADSAAGPIDAAAVLAQTVVADPSALEPLRGCI